MKRIIMLSLLALIISANGLCNHSQPAAKENNKSLPGRVLTCMNNGKRMSEFQFSILRQGDIKTVIVKKDSVFLFLSLERLKKIEQADSLLLMPAPPQKK